MMAAGAIQVGFITDLSLRDNIDNKEKKGPHTRHGVGRFIFVLEILFKIRYGKEMKGEEIIAESSEDTKKIARLLAEEVMSADSDRAVVLALEGDLGAGKTTFAQGFASSLGIKERVLSPTFVLMKIYEIQKKNARKKHFVHIDCYRLRSPDELLHLGFNDLLKDRDAIIMIEWADRIKKILPRDAIRIVFGEAEKRDRRSITIFSQDPLHNT